MRTRYSFFLSKGLKFSFVFSVVTNINSIKFFLHYDVQCVVLHSLDTEILEESVELLLDGFSLELAGVGYDYDREFLILYTAETLTPDLPLKIHIEFIR